MLQRRAVEALIRVSVVPRLSHKCIIPTVELKVMIRYLDLGHLCLLLKGVFGPHVTFVILKQNKTFILVFDIGCRGRVFVFVFVMDPFRLFLKT